MDRFPTALRGYHRAEVDAVMARVDGTLGRAPLTAPPITPQELGQARFNVVLRGYDRAVVDAALTDAAALLGGAPTPPPGQAGYAPPAAVPDESPETARDRMLARLRDPRLEVTKFGPGYDQADVNRFLEHAVAALSGAAPPLTPADVQAAAFAGTRLRGGYSEEAVDALLDELTAHLARYGSR